jgi:ABC-type transport system involved in Fe-S cluster assembly fused permease/ATPase subunit
MGWLIPVVMALCFAFLGYSRAKRAGVWSWSKFFFSVGFALFEGALISAPLLVMSTNSPYFWPAYIAAWVVAAALFVWFIVKARKWKLADGRTSLEADREQRSRR